MDPSGPLFGSSGKPFRCEHVWYAKYQIHVGKKSPPSFGLFHEQKNVPDAGIKIELCAYGSTAAATLKMAQIKDSGVAKPNNISYIKRDLACLSHMPLSLPEGCPDRGRGSLHFPF